MLTQKGSNDLAVRTEHDTPMLSQKGSNDLAVNTEHNTSMLKQNGSHDYAKGSNDLAVNTEHDTPMLRQKGSNDFAVNSEHNTSMLTQKGSKDFVLNTKRSIHPWDVPQTQIKPTIVNKVLKVNIKQNSNSALSNISKASMSSQLLVLQ
ncbi:hypothetical protein DPMN_002705 [Dreissena polymorpha]|uniref:Uncharacterized protein n=1 Tax=Dreissena polymorpha TaxID=45954 RepID=A0A9D4RU38_DREPO|nr:hypothetical protein DPMN_002705 [Dreissena polymorpha]